MNGATMWADLTIGIVSLVVVGIGTTDVATIDLSVLPISVTDTAFVDCPFDDQASVGFKVGRMHAEVQAVPAASLPRITGHPIIGLFFGGFGERAELVF